ncbi:hypothetical protein RJ641_006255 [Dillenia turbinata]|uniref:Uncharacterized protein n=1 Tax=Dillenia turbinata TaxID=194707 RepID=A0AAN8V9W0_9MAGN
MTGVLGLLTVPAVLVVSVGIFLDEPHKPDFAYQQVCQNFLDVCKALWTTCVLMFGGHVYTCTYPLRTLYAGNFWLRIFNRLSGLHSWGTISECPKEPPFPRAVLLEPVALQSIRHDGYSLGASNKLETWNAGPPLQGLTGVSLICWIS